ncbi:MAG: hypothetical protein K2X55_02830 [Burkholderiaceae bacterium]|nr:hypothetical protein [Burkholderiaceae bacterium]
MRLIPLLFALSPLPVVAAEVHLLWPLVDEAQRHVSPAAIQAAFSQSEQANLTRCSAEQGYTHLQVANYFSAIKVNLGPRKHKTYAVFPSLPCTDFFGAHSVRFWLVALDDQGKVSILLSAQQDSFEILGTVTRGVRDLKLRYNNEIILMRFNGTKYEAVRELILTTYCNQHLLCG